MQARSIVLALSRPFDWPGFVSLGRKALDWWFIVLSDLIPRSFQRRLYSLRRIPPTLVIGRRDIGMFDGIDQQALGQSEIFEDINDMVSIIESWSLSSSAPWRTLISIKRDLTFSRDIVLPVSAIGSLSAIVQHQIPKLVPMSVEGVATTHTIVRRQKSDKTMVVRVTLVKQCTIARVRNLALRAGLTVTRIVAQDVSGKYSTIWKTGSLVRPRTRDLFANYPKVLIFLFLMSAVVLVFLIRNHSLDTSLLREVTSIQMQATDTIALSRQLNIEREREAYLNRRIEASSAGAVLAALSLLLPTDTSLSQFVYQNGIVTCSGKSRHAASLIELIENSKFFANPRFTSATTLSADGSSETFDLTFVVRQDNNVR